jgi:hypothetical protein
VPVSLVATMAPALRARQGPSAACGGALRAALTRARAAAWGQLCNEGQCPSLRSTKGTYCDIIFSLTEESRYAC